MRARGFVYCAALVIGMSCAVLSTQDRAAAAPEKERRQKVSLSMRVTPAISFSPSKVLAVGELKGEPPPETEAELYCASVQWNWGDGTRSEFQYDCEPYEEGKSELKRRFSAQHTFQNAGRYRVTLQLKRNERTVITGNSSVVVRAGLGEMGQEP